jgi:hypothetical protein
MDFEKLGSFYLGRPYDLSTKSGVAEPLMYASKDLVTHGVCVGMTGSGKTGLCLALLEEAAIDRIPALIVDPKGDLGNLLLAFPDLKPEDFRPWVQESLAAQKGLSVEEFAAQQAQLWRDGLAKWGQTGDRIRKFRESVDIAIYTPGSEAGIPVSVLKSFRAPGDELIEDRELFRERIASTATAILSLVTDGEINPLQSKEHILISQILDSAWRSGQDLDLAALIAQIQTPPFQRVGVLELDSFYPADQRFALAMKLNALLASPGFEAWMHGEALDIDRMLYTETGTPRLSIFSIAHLGDQERMFFVSLLLNETVAWMRRQSGTTSLRALFYMDEVFGYLPPVKNPPSKQALMTLMKQARAFGLGVLLATQNTMDLDYKALSNAGTWFVGRLQTERDQARILDGLEGTAAGTGLKFERREMGQLLSSLGNRMFLLYDVHRERPEVFESRWAMSYLRGPLTRSQIKQLMDPRKQSTSAAAGASGAAAPSSKPAVHTAQASARPLLAPDVPQTFLPVRSAQPAGATLHYEPALVCVGQAQIEDAKAGISELRTLCVLVPFVEGTVPLDWSSATSLNIQPSELTSSQAGPAQFAQPPAPAAKGKNYSAWNKEFANWILTNVQVQLYRSPSLKQVSRPGEEERAFRLRLDTAAREERDKMVEALRAKYATRLTHLTDKVRNAEFTLQRQKQEAQQSKIDSAISIGTSVLGAIFGRGRATTGVSAAGRAYGRVSRESTDVAKAEAALASAQQQLAELQSRIEDEAGRIAERVDPLTEPLETVVVKPKKTGISVQLVSLAWAPYWVNGGSQTPGWA